LLLLFLLHKSTVILPLLKNSLSTINLKSAKPVLQVFQYILLQRSVTNFTVPVKLAGFLK